MPNLVRVRLGKSFLVGMFFGFVLMGCAGLTFPYKFYKPALNSWEGTLLGDKPEHDLPGSVCAPDATSDGKCVVMTAGEFFNLKLEYLDLKQRLINCEGSNAQ